MNIVINAILYHDQPRGVGRYLNNLLENLAEIDEENQYYVYYGPWMKNYDFLHIKKRNFHFISINIPRNKILRNFIQGFLFPLLILKHKPSLLHIPDTSPVIFKTCPTISNIHDLAEFYFPEKYGFLRSYVRKSIARGQANLSNHLVTVSNYSKKDIQRRFDISDNKITSIYNGVNIKLFGNIREKLDIEGLEENKFFLYVGELEKSKNVSIIFEAFLQLPESLKKTYKIVCAGRRGNDYDRLKLFIDKNNLNSQVIILDYVTDEELQLLYNNCKAFIFPSLFEGFGLPIIEAMASGSTVISSNASCLPEVGGEAVLLFNPYKSEELVQKILLIENNNELNISLKEKSRERVEKFSWKHTAEETLKIYKKISKH